MKLFVLVCSLFYIYCCECLEFPDYKNHPCKRTCEYGLTKAKICYYKLTIEDIYSMEPNCLQCLTNNTADCFKKGCIVADGNQRLLTVVNRMVPGPAIQICQGDEVIVDVVNALPFETTTVHWHGMHQKGSTYMDGVPAVTQCPQQPGTTFRYQFRAATAGTHFYHSHTGTQRINGLYGPLIVRVPCNINRHKDLYTFDKSEHTMLIMDWFSNQPQDFVELYHRTGVFNPIISGIMVNGFMFNGSANNPVPPSRFRVTRGSQYRFRIISNGALACPIEMKIDNHRMTIISTDGIDVKAETVDSMVITEGERYDIIIDANQSGDLYWMRFNGTMQCSNGGYAILQYDSNVDLSRTLPSANLSVNTPVGRKFNCINEEFGLPHCLQISGLQSLTTMTERARGPATFKYSLGLDMYPNKTKESLQGVIGPELIAELINNITFKAPSTPLLQNPNQVFCNKENANYGTNNFSECLHGIDIPYNSVFELLIVDEGQLLNMTHPMHLHGYSFWVVAEGRLGYKTFVQDVLELDRKGGVTRNLVNPPLKDVINVPDGGYVYLRIIANNPGMWFIHCHIELHAESGMALVFKTGKVFQFPRLPRRFPRCGNFKTRARPPFSTLPLPFSFMCSRYEY